MGSLEWVDGGSLVSTDSNLLIVLVTGCLNLGAVALLGGQSSEILFYLEKLSQNG